MKTKAQVLGHPLHPILITFPSALIPLALVFDVVYLVTRDALWWTMAFWVLLAGTVGAVVAAIPGLIDYTVIGKQHPARGTATRHLITGLTLIVLSLGALFTRDFGVAPPSLTPWIPVGLLALANVALGFQGFMGGTLVYHHAVGVHPEHPGEYGPGDARPSGEPRPRPGGGRE